MPSNIIAYSAMIEAACAKIMEQPRSVRQQNVEQGIRMIEESRDEITTHTLNGFLFEKICAPETLTSLSWPQLLSIYDHISDEILFRREERRA